MDLVENLGCLCANGAANYVGVYRVVHRHVKCWKESEDAVVLSAVPTSQDTTVDAEVEEGEAKVWDVVDVADDHLLASHFNGDGSFVRNSNLAVVGERDVLVVDTFV